MFAVAGKIAAVGDFFKTIWKNRADTPLHKLIPYVAIVVFYAVFLCFFFIFFGPLVWAYQSYEKLKQGKRLIAFLTLVGLLIHSFIWYTMFTDEGQRQFRPRSYWTEQVSKYKADLRKAESVRDLLVERFNSNARSYRAGDMARNDFTLEQTSLSQAVEEVNQTIQVTEIILNTARNQLQAASDSTF
ncbi:MAG: hypothetical protein V4542_00870 [Pseudomonadota bacterium]